MRHSIFACSSILALSLLACAGGKKHAKSPTGDSYNDVDPFGEKGSSSAASSSDSAADAPATPDESKPAPAPRAASGKRDAKIMALAKAALACKFADDGTFDEDCAAFSAWRENEALFEDGRGNETLFSMLGDSDEKIRVLGGAKQISEAKTFFADKGRATKLFAIAKEQPEAGREVGTYVAYVDAERLGLANELKALTKHPSTPFRKGLASVITHHQSPAALAAINVLLGDREPTVQEAAINALSAGGTTPAVEPVCQLLVKQLARPERAGAAALAAASTSKCAGMDTQIVFELTKRTADPKKITNAVGPSYGLAASGVCARTQSADLKRKAFAVGRKLTDSAVPDVNTRRSAMAVLRDCDATAAAAAFKTLSKDKDKSVSDGAKKELDSLRAKSAK